MCWIGALKSGHELTEDQLNNAFCSNSHGSGFAYNLDGKLIISKGYMSFDEFYQAYKKVGDGVSRVIHHRFATGGAHNEENCHPFEVVKNKLCFAHNGIISSFSPTAEFSDTHLFCDKIVRPLIGNRAKLIREWYIRWLLTESVGSNKLVFLDYQGEFVIINPQQGYLEKDGAVWFSSKSHEYSSRRGSGGVRYYPARNARSIMWGDDTESVDKSTNYQVTSAINREETYPEWLMRHYLEYVRKKEEEKSNDRKTEEEAKVE